MSDACNGETVNSWRSGAGDGGQIAVLVGKWGATAGELQQKLPGDDLVPDVHDQLTYAITIDAPVAAIWPCLMQIGQGPGSREE